MWKEVGGFAGPSRQDPVIYNVQHGDAFRPAIICRARGLTQPLHDLHEGKGVMTDEQENEQENETLEKPIETRE